MNLRFPSQQKLWCLVASAMFVCATLATANEKNANPIAEYETSNIRTLLRVSVLENGSVVASQLKEVGKDYKWVALPARPMDAANLERVLFYIDQLGKGPYDWTKTQVRTPYRCGVSFQRLSLAKIDAVYPVFKLPVQVPIYEPMKIAHDTISGCYSGDVYSLKLNAADDGSRQRSLEATVLKLSTILEVYGKMIISTQKN